MGNPSNIFSLVGLTICLAILSAHGLDSALLAFGAAAWAFNLGSRWTVRSMARVTLRVAAQLAAGTLVILTCPKCSAPTMFEGGKCLRCGGGQT